MWAVPTLLATSLWALADVFLDTCILEEEDPAVEPPAKDVVMEQVISRPMTRSWKKKMLLDQQVSSCVPVQDEQYSESSSSDEPMSSSHLLTGEQGALLSGFVSLLWSVIVICFIADGGIMERLWDMRGAAAFAVLSGAPHFMAYLLLLKAYETASSTVITPLLQLSALWMLPISTTIALYDGTSVITPFHLLGFVLIIVGGFIPAADGNLSMMLCKSFWYKPFIKYTILSELLVCVYNIVMHRLTYELNEPRLAVWDFFALSRLGNFITCSLLFTLLPSLRQQVLWMEPQRQFVACCFTVTGQSIAVAGLVLVTWSYACFYEPAVVNAAEGGLQQVINILLAITLHALVGLGRRVTHLSAKLLSCGIVLCGLVCTNLELIDMVSWVSPVSN
jgi:hypothetical protein